MKKINMRLLLQLFLVASISMMVLGCSEDDKEEAKDFISSLDDNKTKDGDTKDPKDDDKDDDDSNPKDDDKDEGNTHNGSGLVDISTIDIGLCEVMAGKSITEDVTWNAGCYQVTGNIYVENDTRLTIQPNTFLFFNDGVNIRIDGGLKAVGTKSQPIVFRGKQDTPGYWEGLYFYNANDTHNKLSYVTISDGITNLNIDGNTRIDVQDSLLLNAKKYGVIINEYASVVNFKNVTSTKNKVAGYIDAKVLNSLDGSSDFTGNTKDYIELKGNTLVADDIVWNKLTVPLYITSSIYVEDDGFLTINAGNELIVSDGTRIRIDGGMKAVGTSKDKIIFRGKQNTPGYWSGLYFYNANNSKNEIAYASVSDGMTNIHADGDTRLNVHDTSMSNAKENGLRIDKDYAIVTRNDNTFSNNSEDILVD